MNLTRLFFGLAALAATIVPASAIDEFQLGGAAKGTPSTVYYKFGGSPAIAVFVQGPGNLIYARSPRTTARTGWIGRRFRWIRSTAARAAWRGAKA